MLLAELGYQYQDFRMMDWNERKVLILGAARQGIALARYLVSHGAEITLNDFRPLNEFQSVRESLAQLTSTQGYKPVRWVCGGHPIELLDSADLLCLSGGIPLDLPIVAAARVRGISITNDSQIFLEAVPCRVIGITGSAGKTTTTTLVGHIAEAAVQLDRSAAGYNKVWVGGNIGTPLLTVLDEMSPNDLAIMELSSFQLEIMTRAPDIAAVLNITPNHLDRHHTMQAYIAAKTRILTFQGSQDKAILSRDDPGSWGLAGKVQGDMISFGLTEPILSQADKDTLIDRKRVFLRGESIYLQEDDGETFVLERNSIQLRGEHNLQNVLAACAIAAAAAIPVEAMRLGVEGFTGVPHRLEFVRIWRGAKWYNDSIATAPERAMAAIRSFDEPLVLLAGGRDKDLPWEDFVRLVCQRVDHLILFGEAAGKVEGVFDQICPSERRFTLSRCSTLSQAIQAAASIVEPQDVVLLSPGGTSFDEFHDFEERGECFRQLVKQL